MLDAFFQFACNPTSPAAGYGLDENYPYIARNLAAHHGIPMTEAEKYIATLRDECDSLKEVAKSLQVVPRVQIREIQLCFQKALTLGKPWHVLCEGVLSRLAGASEETRRSLLTFRLLDSVGHSMSPGCLTSLADPYSDSQSRWQARYNAMWSDTAPVLTVLGELLHSGAALELYWVPSHGARSAPHPVVQEGIVPALRDMEALGTNLPSVPDIPVLLETLWQQRKNYDLVRLIDILAHSYEGVLKLDEMMPPGVSIPGFMGVHGHHVALSPAVIMAARQHVDWLKSEKMERMRLRVERALLAVKRKMGAAIGIGVVWTGMGEVLWRFDDPRIPPLYVCLSPWLTAFGQSPGLSRIGLHEKPHIVLMVPYQSRPSLLASLEKYFGLSLSDSRQEKSVSLLSDLDKPDGLQVLIGQRHPLLEEVMAALRGNPMIADGRRQNAPAVAVAPVVEPFSKPSQISAHLPGRGKRESIFIGHDCQTGERVDWEPGSGAKVSQPNRNVAIVGKPGSGKTELVKAASSDLAQAGIPCVALDWVGEYSDFYANTIDAGNGITINPLELPSGATPYGTALEIASIIRAVFTSLGDIQECLLRDAVLSAYKNRGILEDCPDTWKLSPPTFDEVADILRIWASEGPQKSVVPGLLGRISPFVELKIFSGSTTIPFEKLLREGGSINLRSLYTDDFRAVVGHFVLNKLWLYIVQTLGGADEARFYLMMDEANRLSFPGSPLERLVRESRKFGGGNIVASQRPGDFTDTVLANTACTIALQCPLLRDAAFLAKQMNCRAADIQGLGVAFDALVKFDYEAEARRVKVVPHHQRVQEGGGGVAG